MNNREKDSIKVKAMCVIMNNGKVLASDSYDNISNERFHRLPGGHVEFGETCQEAVRREIKEELNSDLENLKLLQAVENTFVYRGRPGHEIVFIYTGVLANKNIYQQEVVVGNESGNKFNLVWVPFQDVLDKKALLFPTFDLKLINSHG